MSFSNIAVSAKGSLSGASLDAQDPILHSLAAAWANVRGIRQLEFEADSAADWLRRVGSFAGDIEFSIRQHLRLTESNEARSIRSARRTTSDLTACPIEEHLLLEKATQQFLRQCRVRSIETIWTVVEIGERAVELEMALARHHNRLSVQMAAQATGTAQS